MRNYINIQPKDYDRDIYRVFSYDRLVELFKTRRNTLVKPKKWDDPFENFILNIPLIHKDGRILPSILRERGYGQCWTKTIESDALWRIYAPDKDGVKIRTTVRKLFKSLYSAQNSYAGISCYIGDVEYWTFLKKVDAVKSKLLIS